MNTEKTPMTKRLLAILTVALLLAAMVPVGLAATSQVYYNIDFSEEVLASRVNQRVSGGCAVAAMATVESYMYGAKTEDEIETVYDALIDANNDRDNYAYWSKCGFANKSDINWKKVYNQLASGYPCIVHRPKSATFGSEHWSVVAGYVGSTTTLEKDKFIIVEVNQNFKVDIYTSGEWSDGTKIDKMVLRKNGISLDELSGIRFAINHPEPVHTYLNALNVYGHISSDEMLTSVRVLVTDVNAGSDLYDKTVLPDSTSYQIYALDEEMTYSSWPKGQYFLTVTAQTESETKVFQKYFEIRSDWPDEEPMRVFNMTVDRNDGSQLQTGTAIYGQILKIPAELPERAGYLFRGWKIRRDSDGKWLGTDDAWCSDEEAALIQPGEEFLLDHQWLDGCIYNSGYTLVVEWEANFVYGDADGDETITEADLTRLRQYLAGRDPQSGENAQEIYPGADCNGDGNLNALDLSLLIRYLNSGESVVLGPQT